LNWLMSQHYSATHTPTHLDIQNSVGRFERWWCSHWQTAIVGSALFAIFVLMVAIATVGLIFTGP
jgi:hypothetical protein